MIIYWNHPLIGPTSEYYGIGVAKLWQSRGIISAQSFTQMVTNSLLLSSETTSENLRDPAGYYYVFTKPTAEGENRSNDTWASASAGSSVWTSGAAGSSSWTSSTVA